MPRFIPGANNSEPNFPSLEEIEFQEKLNNAKPGEPIFDNINSEDYPDANEVVQEMAPGEPLFGNINSEDYPHANEVIQEMAPGEPLFGNINSEDYPDANEVVQEMAPGEPLFGNINPEDYPDANEANILSEPDEPDLDNPYLADYLKSSKENKSSEPKAPSEPDEPSFDKPADAMFTNDGESAPTANMSINEDEIPEAKEPVEDAESAPEIKAPIEEAKAPEVQAPVEEVKVEEAKAPVEEAKAEKAKAPVDEVKAEEAKAPEKPSEEYKKAKADYLKAHEELEKIKDFAFKMRSLKTKVDYALERQGKKADTSLKKLSSSLGQLTSFDEKGLTYLYRSNAEKIDELINNTKNWSKDSKIDKEIKNICQEYKNLRAENPIELDMHSYNYRLDAAMDTIKKEGAEKLFFTGSYKKIKELKQEYESFNRSFENIHKDFQALGVNPSKDSKQFTAMLNALKQAKDMRVAVSSPSEIKKAFQDLSIATAAYIDKREKTDGIFAESKRLNTAKALLDLCSQALSVKSDPVINQNGRFLDQMVDISGVDPEQPISNIDDINIESMELKEGVKLNLKENLNGFMDVEKEVFNMPLNQLIKNEGKAINAGKKKGSHSAEIKKKESMKSGAEAKKVNGKKANIKN